MSGYKVEICGVNTAKLPLLSNEEKEVLFKRILDGDKEAREQYIKGNLRLVLSVIQRFSGNQENIDDLFQIGCIGLCKAAATDKGGTFSTYAYRLIWNEICDALIYSTRRQATEFSSDMIPLVAEEPTVSIADVATQLDVQAALKAAKQEASPCVVKGIDAMIQMTKGRSSKEIGNEFGVSANLVCAWVSKARKYLKSRPEILALAET